MAMFVYQRVSTIADVVDQLEIAINRLNKPWLT